MKISEIMNKDVTTIDKDQTVHDALTMMGKRSVSKLPVIDNGKLVGIVTHSDILKVLGSSRQQALPTHIHLSSAMTKDVKVTSEDHDMAQAANIMITYGISALPVMNGDELVGIVTRSDLVERIDNEKETVGNFMVPPITISSTDRIVRAREIMFEKNISMLPILDDGEFVGIISEEQLAEVLKVFRDKNQKHQAEKVKQILVEDTMSRDITSVTADTPLMEAIKTMDSKNVTSLPVVENKKLVGVISKTDVLTLLR